MDINNGLLIQFGTCKKNISYQDNIEFPIAFTKFVNMYSGDVATGKRDDTDGFGFGPGIFLTTLTSFSISVAKSSNRHAHWLAIGI